MKPNFKLIALVFLSLFLTTSCEEDEELIILPTVNITNPANLAPFSFNIWQIEHQVTNVGLSSIFEHGIVVGNSPNPIISDPNLVFYNVETTNPTTPFTSVVAGLEANTTYYYKGYAVNLEGTGYSQEFTFTTLDVSNTNWKLSYEDISGNPINAKVTFNNNGTAYYQDLDNSSITYNGTWSMTGSMLTYDRDSSDTSVSYIFTGIVHGGTIGGGTYTLDSNLDGVIDTYENIPFTGIFL